MPERRLHYRPRPANTTTWAMILLEDQLQEWLIDSAARNGWLWHHDIDSRRVSKSQWNATGHLGFPDLVLLHPVRAVIAFVELKDQDGYTTAHQDTWLVGLAMNPHVTVKLWRPSDRDEIEAFLEGRS